MFEFKIEKYNLMAVYVFKLQNFETYAKNVQM